MSNTKNILAISTALILIAGIVGIAGLNSSSVYAKDVQCVIQVDGQSCTINAKNIDDIKIGSLVIRVYGGGGGVVVPPPGTTGNVTVDLGPIKSDITQLQNQVADLQETNGQQAGEISGLQSDLSTTKQALNASNNNVQTLTAQLNQLTADFEDFKSKVVTGIDVEGNTSAPGSPPAVDNGTISTPSEPIAPQAPENGNNDTSNSNPSTSEENDQNNNNNS